MKPKNARPWTEAEQRTLNAMLDAKRSATEIGAALGRTKHAVLGRVDRTRKGFVFSSLNSNPDPDKLSESLHSHFRGKRVDQIVRARRTDVLARVDHLLASLELDRRNGRAA
jgi:hypothetical protein